MKINDKEINVREAIEFANIENILLKKRKNGLLLSDYQMNVLKRNGIDYNKYGNIHELLFDIEEYLNDNYDEDLDLISGQLAELIYYKDTKK